MNDELWCRPVLNEDGWVPFGIARTVFPDFTFELGGVLVDKERYQMGELTSCCGK